MWDRGAAADVELMAATATAKGSHRCEPRMVTSRAGVIHVARPLSVLVLDDASNNRLRNLSKSVNNHASADFVVARQRYTHIERERALRDREEALDTAVG